MKPNKGNSHIKFDIILLIIFVVQIKWYMLIHLITLAINCAEFVAGEPYRGPAKQVIQEITMRAHDHHRLPNLPHLHRRPLRNAGHLLKAALAIELFR